MKPKAKKEIFNFLEYNKNILQSYGVKKIGLFGSYVRNQQNKKSDIDILVEFHTNKKNYTNFINLVYYLEDNLNTKVDLLTVESLSPYIGNRILNEVEYVSFE
ncbi:nucleotidyltransferase family protein [Treponema phagedenis]|uniref:Nucleotidyltransferase family protein n=1 Tax=Treponema phagedenis TaxID=162 RepID=A0AAE6M8L9_TREPH|nr:nucleotidyltransferase family protein [Treponema phagedenis]QEJ99084.1 nucleotidyltransferase family protein [Treponema phagedenis]QEJ99090.1 nucleotidyltransferase family protein [Treponema phagedenis]QEK04595.1 nucleotidyltransferase family protein [Treponema phagedenis]QEK04602.1 nucleotidyltransferase family protein [Treponema phagedenis]QEK10251.1 nucleotidyltransferase family protein [Treponema phagedenis]